MKNTVARLSILLAFVFSGMVIYGGYLVYQESFPLEKTEAKKTNESDLKLKITEKSASFELSNALPGLIFSSFGFIGLISLLFKLPVKEVLGREQIGSGNSIGFRLEKDVLSKNIIYIPLPVWWILQGTNRLVKAEQGA